MEMYEMEARVERSESHFYWRSFYLSFYFDQRLNNEEVAIKQSFTFRLLSTYRDCGASRNLGRGEIGPSVLLEVGGANCRILRNLPSAPGMQM